MSAAIPIMRSERFSADAVLDFGQKIAVIRLAGSVDENTRLKDLAMYLFKSKGEFKVFRFDMSAIEYLNSVGVQSWIHFLNQIENKIPFEFEALSELMVEKANMLRAILGKPNTRIHFFAAPYWCQKCDQRVAMKLSADMFAPRKTPLKAPAAECPVCHTPMNFDEIEPDYFSFLKPIPAIPARG